MKLEVLLLFLSSAFTLYAQTYTSFFTGDTSDVQTNHQPGYLLAGGGSDSDPAMRWLIQQADGGDVLVLRASGGNGYNSYLFSELSVNVNSVETIRFESAAASNDPYVLRRIEEAETIFIAGGNQSVYRDYWRDTPVADAINTFINQKGGAIGGTSAGMAVLGDIYYAPENGSLDSEEALSNPYHPDVVGLSDQPFFSIPLLENTITDTHFENRDRQGRLLVMLARANAWTDEPVRAIACNDATAVAIDPSGIARVFGEYPEFPDYAWFVTSACTDDGNGPELMQSGQPITWNNNGQALSAYRLHGDQAGSLTFDISAWSPNGGGFWQFWSANAGELQFTSPGQPPRVCSPSSTSSPSSEQVTIFPNPASSHINIQSPSRLQSAKLFDSLGRMVLEKKVSSPASDLSDLRTSAGSFLSISPLPNSAESNPLANTYNYVLKTHHLPGGIYQLQLLDLDNTMYKYSIRIY